MPKFNRKTDTIAMLKIYSVLNMVLGTFMVLICTTFADVMMSSMHKRKSDLRSCIITAVAKYPKQKMKKKIGCGFDMLHSNSIYQQI